MEDVVTEQEDSKVNPYIVAIAVLLPSFLALAASSGTNVSQPHIAGFYGATQYETNTVITCYIISGGLMLPVTGYLVRLMGKKLLFMYSIIVFTLGCFLCIISPNLISLILARLIQDFTFMSGNPSGGISARAKGCCNGLVWCCCYVFTACGTVYGWLFD